MARISAGAGSVAASYVVGGRQSPTRRSRRRILEPLAGPVLLILAMALAVGRPGHAQIPAAKDSAAPTARRADSLTSDSTHWSAGSYRGPHALGGALYSALIAPSWMTTFMVAPTTP